MVHWYKRDPHAAIEGMLGLTLEERGAYNTLIDMLYARDGLVPNDDRFMAIAQQCDPRTWRRLRDSLIAKGKVRITENGSLTARRVERELREVEDYSETQRRRAEVRWKKPENPSVNNNGAMPLPAMPSGNASTSTSTSIKSFLSSSLTTSEWPQPSAELLKHEAKKRATPGSLATAPFDSALARPAFAAATRPAKPPLSKPFTPEEVGKPSGWEWDNPKTEADE